MGFFGRLLGTIPYFLCFACAAIILGFYSYFLAVLSDRNSPIPSWEKAVEGISGVAVVYTIVAIVLTPCLGGVRFFAFLGMILDIAFAAAFIAVAVLTRDGLSSCDGRNIDTPIGSGDSNAGNGFGAGGFGTGDGEQATYKTTFGTACRFNKACCAVAIIAVFLFLLAALCQFFFARVQQKEKRYGPSPANNYTSGSGRNPLGFFRRKRAKTVDNGDSTLGDFGAGVPASTVSGAEAVGTRPSGETAYTGSTVAPNNGGTTKYEPYRPSAPAQPIITGPYYTQQTPPPMSNPYGYDKTAAHHNF
ncbi:uncharacterized protein IWZ02DRAFT_459060 [Phyllosticta citriasiana]|uniref:uncharacterized protein n=1 Tax=Phyllosticta citriasiana TaxID=595635 RepID=UPI0030FD4D1A